MAVVTLAERAAAGEVTFARFGKSKRVHIVPHRAFRISTGASVTPNMQRLCGCYVPGYPDGEPMERIAFDRENACTQCARRYAAIEVPA